MAPKFSLPRSLAPALRAVSGALVAVALLSAALHYEGVPADNSKWDKDSINDPEKALHMTNLTDGSDLLVPNTYYETNVTYQPLFGMTSYEGDHYERKIAHRVWILPINEGITEFWAKHYANKDGEDIGDHRPNDDDYATVDVIEDLTVLLWISFGWFAGMMLIAAVSSFLEMSGTIPHLDEEGNGSDLGTGGNALLGLYLFVCSFESNDASEQFIRLLGLSGQGTTSLTNAVAIVIRSAIALVCEGFFIFVCSVSVVYAYVVLYSMQGTCAQDTTLPGRCSIQRVPVPRLETIVLLLLAIVGRIASGYNYSDGNWDRRVGDVKGALEEAAEALTGVEQVLTKVQGHLTSTTVQTFACFLSVGCSSVILIMLSSAFYSIGEDRRFPYEAIWTTVLVLELLFISLNVLVLALSSTRLIKNLRNLKFYIEGKLFGALFITAIGLSIYMSLRRGINMHGTLLTSGDIDESFGHYVTKLGDDTLHDLSLTEWNSMMITFEGAYHGKQLSEHDEHCHYIPKHVFEHPEDYSYNQTLCAHGHFDYADAPNAAAIDVANTTVNTEQTEYDAAVAALAADPTDAALTTAVENALGDLENAQAALNVLLKGAQKFTLVGTCCLAEEYDDSGTNATSTYTGLWVALGGLGLQVALLVATALLYNGDDGDDGSDVGKNALYTFPEVIDDNSRLHKSSVPQGFKTIRVV